MQIQFSTNAADMKRTCRRVGMRSTCQSKFITFKIAAKDVEITANGVSETLAAKIKQEGRVSIPSAILDGVLRTLPYFGERTIKIGFSEGRMRVDNMVFHNRMIVLSDSVSSDRRQSFLGRRSFASELA